MATQTRPENPVPAPLVQVTASPPSYDEKAHDKPFGEAVSNESQAEITRLADISLADVDHDQPVVTRKEVRFLFGRTSDCPLELNGVRQLWAYYRMCVSRRGRHALIVCCQFITMAITYAFQSLRTCATLTCYRAGRWATRVLVDSLPAACYSGR